MIVDVLVLGQKGRHGWRFITKNDGPTYSPELWGTPEKFGLDYTKALLEVRFFHLSTNGKPTCKNILIIGWSRGMKKRVLVQGACKHGKYGGKPIGHKVK
jgi:hypothetical protein